ncbi:MAG: hypothetical protein ACPIOQ_12840 [Promethearchaeia archaeon]
MAAAGGGEGHLCGAGDKQIDKTIARNVRPVQEGSTLSQETRALQLKLSSLQLDNDAIWRREEVRREQLSYLLHRHTGIEVIRMRREEFWREQLSYMLHTDTQASKSHVWDTRRCGASSCLCLPDVCLIRLSCINRCGESSCSRHWMR